MNTGKSDAILYAVSDWPLFEKIGQYRVQGRKADGTLEQPVSDPLRAAPIAAIGSRIDQIPEADPMDTQIDENAGAQSNSASANRCSGSKTQPCCGGRGVTPTTSNPRPGPCLSSAAAMPTARPKIESGARELPRVCAYIAADLAAAGVGPIKCGMMVQGRGGKRGSRRCGRSWQATRRASAAKRSLSSSPKRRRRRRTRRKPSRSRSIRCRLRHGGSGTGARCASGSR